MFRQLLSLITIVAVIACPLWCSAGLCNGGECCATTSCPVPSQAATACCQHCASQQEPLPAPAPGDDDVSCQGICGGAVLEKPCQLDGPEAILLSALPVETTSACRSPRQVGGALAEGLGDAARNVGRSLCALHMTFLC